MEREIKFRGKDRRTGEWVYGFYCRHDYGAHYQDKKLIKEACSVYDIWTTDGWVAVEETSLGQFTGLTDCNGKEIYEGDIAKYDDTPYNAYASPYIGEVVFYCGSWRIKTKGYGVEWVYPYLFRDDFANRKTEILGNVFDNSSLIPNQPTAI